MDQRADVWQGTLALGKEPHERAHIGDRVVFVEEHNGVACYRKGTASGSN
jgi:hypothetical protein